MEIYHHDSWVYWDLGPWQIGSESLLNAFEQCITHSLYVYMIYIVFMRLWERVCEYILHALFIMIWLDRSRLSDGKRFEPLSPPSAWCGRACTLHPLHPVSGVWGVAVQGVLSLSGPLSLSTAWWISSGFLWLGGNDSWAPLLYCSCSLSKESIYSPELRLWR